LRCGDHRVVTHRDQALRSADVCDLLKSESPRGGQWSMPPSMG
jgi:hypothetical protein